MGVPMRMTPCPGVSCNPLRGSGLGDWPSGTYLAEELVIVLRDEQEAAAQRLGLLLQLRSKGRVSTPACPEHCPGRIQPLPCLPAPRAPTRVTENQVPLPRTSSPCLSRFTLETTDGKGKAVHSGHY